MSRCAVTRTPASKDKLERYARRLWARWLRAVRAADTAPSMAEVGRRYGLLHKDIQRARRMLDEPRGMVRLLQRARRAAPRRLRAEMEAAVLHLARAEPQWGRKRLARAVRDRGFAVCPMTVRRVLRRRGAPTPTGGQA